jgi:hypothetical protein
MILLGATLAWAPPETTRSESPSEIILSHRNHL